MKLEEDLGGGGKAEVNGRTNVAIIGSGNIGTDLMYKMRRSPSLQLTWVVGIVPNSEGLARAADLGYGTCARGIDELMEHLGDFKVAFDATTAQAHQVHADRLGKAGKFVIDLTPAAVGPRVVPTVNGARVHFESGNLNLTTCGGQATVPIVFAIDRVAPVRYAEIVSTVVSKSAGPGTRQNIDEFTETTARALMEIGGARKSKAIIILNPADPPMLMRNTVYARVEHDPDREVIIASVDEMMQAVQEYVPGYRLKAAPLFEGDIVTVLLEVEGSGDYLPRYAGNLDIMTSAAVRVGEQVASWLRQRDGAGLSVGE